jgi:hypothetical protein
MTSREFWQWVDRLQIPDADALALIGYPGKIGPSGKRPRFRLTAREARLAHYLPEIKATLQAADQAPAWLQPRRAVLGPRTGCTHDRTRRGRCGRDAAVPQLCGFAEAAALKTACYPPSSRLRQPNRQVANNPMI